MAELYSSNNVLDLIPTNLSLICTLPLSSPPINTRSADRCESKNTSIYETSLTDLKIMDAGQYAAELVFNSGCRFVTILGLESDDTIRRAISKIFHYTRLWNKFINRS
jgi:hypothetical protein